MTYYYTVSSTDNDGNITDPFSRKSYTHAFGVTDNTFGAFNGFDFTMNSNGHQIARVTRRRVQLDGAHIKRCEPVWADDDEQRSDQVAIA